MFGEESDEVMKTLLSAPALTASVFVTADYPRCPPASQSKYTSRVIKNSGLPRGLLPENNFADAKKQSRGPPSITSYLRKGAIFCGFLPFDV